MARVVVLGGGNSSEREVSLRSAKSVQKALNSAGIENTFVDPKHDSSYLDAKDSIIFPILHGEFGEDGQVQKLLEEKNTPFLGSDSTSSANCFDKWKTIEILKAANIKVAPSDYISLDQYKNHELASAPHVLKDPGGGSSIGTYIIRRPSDLSGYEKKFSGKKLIIEELIEGIELTVAILDSESLPPIEIQPPEGGEFDYENKYNGSTKEICPPVSADTESQKYAQELALKVHKIMGCRHLSRVDIMLDKKGEAYVLEINTIPGMTDQSLYPKEAAAAGIDMPALVKCFHDMVVRDYSLD